MNTIILILTLFLLSVILLYWLWFSVVFGHKKLNEPVLENDTLPSVSVIICYKNASNHIRKTVMAVLNQDFPEFEIVTIDDFSSDHSFELISDIDDPRLIKLMATKDLPGKKSALTEAIEKAKYSVLLFTDADCTPNSINWISSMTKKLINDPNTEIVLGYGPMHRSSGFVNIFARYETILTAIQYFSYAFSGLPYMGVGRNLMYKKQLFERVNGFSTHHQIASGDDDLMISQVANIQNTSISLDPDCFVYSASKNDLISFFNQKTRHISTSHYYKFKHKVMLACFALCQVMFYIVLSFGYFSGFLEITTVILLLCFKWSIQILLQKRIFYLLDGNDLMIMFPLLDICMSIYYVCLPVYGLFRKPKW